MPEATPKFAAAVSEIAAQVNADAATIMQRGDPNQQPQPAPQPAPKPATTAAPAPAPGAGGTAAPAVGTTPATEKRLYLGKFTSEEEATKAHHLLIHDTNALRGQLDESQKRIAALEAQVTRPVDLSPGRADPSRPMSERAAALSKKFIEEYGIDPKDVRDFVEDVAREIVDKENAPRRAMEQADAYILQQYPDFAEKQPEIKAFMSANPAVAERVATLYSKGMYAEAMEIAYLAYDNALRTFNAAAAEGAQTTGRIADERAHAAAPVPQTGGPKDPSRAANGFPQTAEEWNEIRAMRAAGKDTEVRQRLFGHIIGRIPDLNGSR